MDEKLGNILWIFEANERLTLQNTDTNYELRGETLPDLQVFL